MLFSTQFLYIISRTLHIIWKFFLTAFPKFKNLRNELELGICYNQITFHTCEFLKEHYAPFWIISALTNSLWTRTRTFYWRIVWQVCSAQWRTVVIRGVNYWTTYFFRWLWAKIDGSYLKHAIPISKVNEFPCFHDIFRISFSVQEFSSIFTSFFSSKNDHKWRWFEYVGWALELNIF